MKKLLYVVLSLSILSCNKDTETTTPEPNNETKITKSTNEEIISYYKTQINNIGVTENPNTKMYSEVIDKDSIEYKKKRMWLLWKEANTERIEQSELTEQAINESGQTVIYGINQTNGITPIWDIPQNERMKIKMFFKEQKPQTNYPMIISLHGGGEYPDVTSAWASTINSEQWSATIDIARRCTDAPVFYAIPRMADDRKGNWHYAPQIKTFKKAIQIAMLSDITDPKRIYITGISQGGYGTIYLAQFMPDYFSAVGAIDAATKISENISNIRNIAFRMKVGEKDYEYGRVNYAYNWQDKLKELQASNPNNYLGEVIIEKGKEHGYVDVFDMTPWMLNYSRNAHPKRITYVYHNIAPTKNEAGIFSEGVYFLDFRKLKHSAQTDRILFDVTQNGNTFNITTQKISGTISGELSIYLNKVDFNEPINIILNGEQIYSAKQKPSIGTIAESIALWGDPLRIFAGKVTINI